MKVILKIIYKNILRILPAKIASQIHYFLVYKRRLNLLFPQYFSEKMIRIKLEEPRYLDVLSTDKITSKELLKRLGYSDFVIENLYVFDKVDDIEIMDCDYPVIIKVSNGTSQNLIINDNEELKTKLIDLKKMFRHKHYLYSKELVYAMAPRRILVEPFLSANKNGLDDYKLHCFNGIPRFIQINYNSTDSKERVMINDDMQQIDFPFASGQEIDWHPHNTSEINKMIKISKNISKFFRFIRIDFFIVDNLIKIGELTLHPMAGFMLRNSANIDFEWGKLIDLDEKKSSESVA